MRQRNPITLLRYSKERDSDFLYLLSTQREYKNFFRRIPIGVQKEWMVNFEENTDTHIFWLIHKDPPHEQIGFITLTKYDPFGLTVNGGVLLLTQYQDRYCDNRKYAFWATLTMAQMIFDDTLFRQIYFKFLKKRTDIIDAFTKGGLNKIAEYPESIYYDGEWEDEVEYVFPKITYLEKFKSHYGR